MPVSESIRRVSTRAAGAWLLCGLPLLASGQLSSPDGHTSTLTGSGEAPAASTPTANSVLSERVLRDFHGDDLTGRDGPLAKIGLPLIVLHHRHRLHSETAAGSAFEPGSTAFPVADDAVLVDLVANAAEANALRDAAGAHGLGAVSAAGRIVSGWVPIERLPEIAGLAPLAFARPVYLARNAGSVTSQADIALRADIARASLGIDGTGVTVGVLSDSYNCLGGAAAGVASGDLPVSVTVLEEISNCTNAIDEGRAMIELIRDIAPGAQQAFHSAFNGAASFADGIVELANVAGADVIVDDVGILSQPWFQDGIIAQAVDQVVAGGAVYFSSAGNFGRQSYEAAYRASGVNGAEGERHDFDAGPGIDTLQSVTIPGNATVRFFLQWDEPFFSISGAPGASTDMDIVVYAGAQTFRAATNNLGGDAFEALSLTNNGGGGVTVDLALERSAGPAPSRLKYAYLGSLTVNEFQADTQAATIFGHANAAGARAVGAAFYFQTPEFGQSPPLLEAFSSRESTSILFDTAGNPTLEVRNKPEIVAADGVDTTFFGSGDSESNGFPNFFGTSAAAPNAAAIAALMLETNPNLTPGQLYALLQESAIDMETAGFDVDSGLGLVQADTATAGAAAVAGGSIATFSSGPAGDILTGDIASDTYAALGFTLVDSDPGSPGTSPVAGPGDPANAATGIVGRYLDIPAVGGANTFLELTFTVPARRVRFSFATPSGQVRITARNSSGTLIADVVETRALAFVHASQAVWLGGSVEVETFEDIATLRIEPVPADAPLVVDSVFASATAVAIPLPWFAVVALAMLLSAIAGTRRR